MQSTTASKAARVGETPRESLSPQPGQSEANEAETAWDEAIVTELASLSYVRAVVLTDGQGRVLYRHVRLERSEELFARLELVLAATEHMGRTTGLGELNVNINLFEQGTLVSARTPEFCATVVGTASANLGQLLSHLRRLQGRRDG